MSPPATSRNSSLVCAGSLTSAWLLWKLCQWRRCGSGTGWMLGQLVWRWNRAPEGGQPSDERQEREEEGEEEGGEEVPEEFLDPITLSCMQDPVLLCGTAQIYCLASLRDWLATGSRTCPKTNVGMRDVEVVRLPSVRSRIAAWRSGRGLPPLPPLNPPPEVLREAGEGVPQMLEELRSGNVYKRGLAAGGINDMLIEWGREEALPARLQAMEAMLLDLVWLMRQGDPYGSGVAAAALSQYDSPGQAAFLAAVAACPAVALLWSPHSYGQHSAARLLASLARASPTMPEVLVEAGAVRGLLQQLDLRVPFKYNRCSAAAALWGLCKCPAGRQEVRQGGGVRLLKEMVLQAEAGEDPGPAGEHLVRFDQRDAAGCLLALHLTEDEANEEPAVSLGQLRLYTHCSHAWLLGRVAKPIEGYNEEEIAAGMPLLATGERRDEEEDEEWEADGVDEEEEPPDLGAE